MNDLDRGVTRATGVGRGMYVTANMVSAFSYMVTGQSALAAVAIEGLTADELDMLRVAVEDFHHMAQKRIEELKESK